MNIEDLKNDIDNGETATLFVDAGPREVTHYVHVRKGPQGEYMHVLSYPPSNPQKPQKTPFSWEALLRRLGTKRESNGWHIKQRPAMQQ